MAIHYDAKAKRFRDDSGRLVSRDRAMRSSVARREYEKAQRKRPAVKAPAKKAPAKKAPAKPKAPRVVIKRHDPFEDGVAPWEREGIVREYPDDDQWFINDGYGYDDLIDEWGQFDDEETDS